MVNFKNDRINNQTIHFVNKGIDTGKILFSFSDIVPKSIRIPADLMKFDISQLLKAYEIFIDCVVKKKF